MAKISKHRAKVLERQARAAERMVTLPERFEKVPVISWYPGHMLKAQREMREKMKLVDHVIELVDARIPYTSLNPNFDPIFQDKPRLMILNKSLLAENEETKKWIKYYRSRGHRIIAIDAFKKRNLDKVLPEIRRIVKNSGSSKKFRLCTRCMIVGIPNVGKSTFINRMAGKKIANTGPTPGVTRHQQWVTLADDVELLDTPGVMFPRIETKADELNLALTAGIKDELVGEQITAEYLLYRIDKDGSLDSVKGLDKFVGSELNPEDLLREYALHRGFLEIGGTPDLHKAAVTLLRLFREGDLGRLSLNTVAELEELARLQKEREEKKRLEKEYWAKVNAEKKLMENENEDS